MEIEGEDGTKILLEEGFKREFGRGLGFDLKDRSVSRRHVSFELRGDGKQKYPNSKSRVQFEVIGKNPIWVYNGESDEIRIFRGSEVGEMEAGDMFCVSAKKPIWFTIKSFEFEGEGKSEMKRELRSDSEVDESSQSSRGLRGVEGLDIDSIEVSHLDPVKEFGFLVMGHEFDQYPKQRIRDVKSWDWFLLEPEGGESEDDEVSDKKGKKRLRRKRKKDEANDDEEWTGESEDDKDLMTKVRKAQRPNYSTRSKDRDKTIKGTRNVNRSVQKKTVGANEEDEEGENEEDEDDDTLGGFIVTDEDMEEEGEEEEEEEAEEEEEEEEEDDDEE